MKTSSVVSVTCSKLFTPHTNPVKKSIPIDEETGTLSQTHTNNKWEIQDTNQSCVTAASVLLAATSAAPKIRTL